MATLDGTDQQAESFIEQHVDPYVHGLLDYLRSKGPNPEPVRHALKVELARVYRDLAALEAEVKSLRAFKRSVDEALNSGDGSYRP